MIFVILIDVLIFAVAFCFGIKTGYMRACGDVLIVVETNKNFCTDMTNDLDEGYYMACNHIQRAVNVLRGDSK